MRSGACRIATQYRWRGRYHKAAEEVVALPGFSGRVQGSDIDVRAIERAVAA